MAFKTLQPNRPRLADAVYDELINAITRRDIGHEDVLVQEKLASEMQISRTPIREALMRLEKEGVLEVSTRGSFKLYKMDETEVKELYQARAAIEGQCARILASNCSQEDLEFLRKTITKEENIKATSVRAYFEANKNIHRSFVKRANNRYLLRMFDMIWGRALTFPLFAAIEKADLPDSLGDHMNLVDAIESRDKGAALEIFTVHIQNGFDLQMKGLNAD